MNPIGRLIDDFDIDRDANNQEARDHHHEDRGAIARVRE